MKSKIKLSRESQHINSSRWAQQMGVAVVWLHPTGEPSYRSIYAYQDFVRRAEVNWKTLELEVMTRFIAPDLKFYSPAKRRRKLEQVNAELTMLRILNLSGANSAASL